MSRHNLNARQPAKNIGAHPPSRKIMGASGVPITEKLSPLWGMKLVAPDGDIATITLSSGFTIRGFKGNDHGVQKLDEKLKAGFLVFAECPVATGRVQGAADDKPCSDKFSDAKCCPHMDKIISERREVHRLAQIEYGKNFATQAERMIAIIEKQAAASIAERPAAPGTKNRIGG